MLFQLTSLLWRRFFRQKEKFFITLAVFLVTLNCITITIFLGRKPNGAAISPLCLEPIDVVYTWVNGSDPNFIESLLKWSENGNYDPSRYDDKNELKYSLRSLERYAPWVRHIYIVTNQIPNWLNLNNKLVSVVPHEQIAPNLDFLPTFSSNAIETFIHRIPKLSKRFLYLNDDFLLGSPLYPEDLYTESEGVRIHQTWPIPNCAFDCPYIFIGDGYCDRHCNNSECQFDNGDCGSETKEFPVPSLAKEDINIAYLQELMKQNFTTLTEIQNAMKALQNNKFIYSELKKAWMINMKPANTTRLYEERDMYTHAVVFTNLLLNRHYGVQPRRFINHVGYLLDRDIIDSMQDKFSDYVSRTASHRFRAKDDIHFQTAYYYFLMNEKVTVSVEKVFDEFDMDDSGTWSDTEVHTFLTRIFSVLNWKAIHFFENVIRNCAKNELNDSSSLPRTRELVSNCPILADVIRSKLATRPKYKHKIIPVQANINHFIILTSNVSEAKFDLDNIRRFPRKFVTLNDNLDRKKSAENEVIRKLLEDFYKSLFPRRSRFELPTNTRSTFSPWQESRMGYFAIILLAVLCSWIFYLSKNKF